MAINYTTTEAILPTLGVKVLVYGNAGVGKTMLCATAPGPLIISAESGLLSLKRKNIEKVFGVNTPGITYDIPVAPIRTIDDLIQVHDDIRQPSWSGSFQTVCLDSLSEIAETVLAHALSQTKDGRAAFGDMAEQVLELCRKFRDLPHNVYFTTKQGFSNDSDLIGPSLPGRMLDREIPYLFDEVMHLHILQDAAGGAVRVLRTVPDLKHYAKDRSGALDVGGEYPSLQNVFNKISAV